MSYENASPVKFFGVSQTTATLGVNDPQLGDRCESGGLSYLFVYNEGTTAAAPGYGLVFNAASTSYSCTISSVTDLDYLAGVVVNTTMATATYGWVANRGPVHIIMGAANSAVTGDIVGIGANGTFSRHKTSAFTDGVWAPCFGKFTNSITSGATGVAYISVYT